MKPVIVMSILVVPSFAFANPDAFRSGAEEAGSFRQLSAIHEPVFTELPQGRYMENHAPEKNHVQVHGDPVTPLPEPTAVMASVQPSNSVERRPVEVSGTPEGHVGRVNFVTIAVADKAQTPPSASQPGWYTIDNHWVHHSLIDPIYSGHYHVLPGGHLAVDAVYIAPRRGAGWTITTAFIGTQDGGSHAPGPDPNGPLIQPINRGMASGNFVPPQGNAKPFVPPVQNSWRGPLVLPSMDLHRREYLANGSAVR